MTTLVDRVWTNGELLGASNDVVVALKELQAAHRALERRVDLLHEGVAHLAEALDSVLKVIGDHR